ncbi:hypothetical protein DPMN_122532 [Dreissena polymorpha]|uniref:Uncharacterized protein n=1 Tax=Dreissena polymorpha TaxID=45954 RepID=A0A9D4GS30_DREPO|nr:hypothetical protein DPMN_122532 [Dreissena polymorpha]
MTQKICMNIQLLASLTTQDISRTNFLTKFYDDHKKINSLAPGGHDFQQTGTIFNLIQDVIETNVLTKFHEDWTINLTFRVLTTKMPRPLHGGHVFQPTNHFRIRRRYYWDKSCFKFHEDRTINVVSRVLTRQMLTPHNGRRTKGNHKSSQRAHCAQIS